ncbi:MAG: phospholipase [Elusimicrobia bacterium]|nr:phospholipase [Elusimicrobiota bacterium]
MTPFLLRVLAAALFAFEVPGFELVYTEPVETTLQNADLRAPHVVWPEMIDAAKRSVDVSQFYVTPKAGGRLDATLAALERAAKRGVKVRVIAEKKMAKASEEGFAALGKIEGLELRIMDFSKIGGGITHAKYFVVDSTAAYLGSQNFDWRSLTHIHELGLRTTEPSIVAGLAAIFAHDWDAAAKVEKGETVEPLRKERGLPPEGARAYLVASPWKWDPEGVADSEAELARLLGSAKESAVVQLLDYNPLSFGTRRFYAPIDNAIRLAATRGVKVRLMVSHWNTEEPAIDHLKSLSLIPNVEIRIVTLPPSKDGYIPYSRVIHSKYLVVDGKTLWLGTSNWAGGYLDDSRNVEAVVYDEALAKRVSAIHDQLWTSSYAAPVDVAKAYPKPKK